MECLRKLFVQKNKFIIENNISSIIIISQHSARPHLKFNTSNTYAFLFFYINAIFAQEIHLPSGLQRQLSRRMEGVYDQLHSAIEEYFTKE